MLCRPRPVAGFGPGERGAALIEVWVGVVMVVVVVIIVIIIIMLIIMLIIVVVVIITVFKY